MRADQKLFFVKMPAIEHDTLFLYWCFIHHNSLNLNHLSINDDILGKNDYSGHTKLDLWEFNITDTFLIEKDFEQN